MAENVDERVGKRGRINDAVVLQIFNENKLVKLFTSRENFA